MLKKSLKKAWAPTVVVTLVFFLNYFIFGRENTLIGPFLTLSFLKFKDMEDYRGCMLRSFGIYAIMAVLSWAALLHPAANILVNAAALFWIGYFLIDEYNPLNYFPAGMALIFFQITPVSCLGVFRRILALAVSFFVVFLFLELTRVISAGRPSRLAAQALQGMDICKRMTDCLDNKEWEKALALRKKLCQSCRSISLMLYEKNRAAIGKYVYDNRYSSLLASFQMINYLAAQMPPGETQEGADLLEQMNQLVKAFDDFNSFDVSKETTKKYCFRENPIDLRSFRLRFALRQVCVMTPCLAFGYLCPWPNRYWLAVSVFFMMIPLYEHTLKRVTQRIKGSVLGIFLCLFLFFLFRGFWARVALMTIANFFIYCSGSYTAMVACITCSALSLNAVADADVMMLLQRVFYTLAGAVIAVGGNLLVFRIRAWRQCQYVMELLEDIEKKMQDALTLEKPERRYLLEQYMIKSYLLAGRMEEFNEAAAPQNKQKDIKEYIKIHLMKTSRRMLSVFKEN